jgi:hypothetical protein
LGHRELAVIDPGGSGRGGMTATHCAPGSSPPICEGPRFRRGGSSATKIRNFRKPPDLTVCRPDVEWPVFSVLHAVGERGSGPLLEHRGPAIGRTATSTIPVQSSTCSEMLSASSEARPRCTRPAPPLLATQNGVQMHLIGEAPQRMSAAILKT